MKFPHRSHEQWWIIFANAVKKWKKVGKSGATSKVEQAHNF